MVLTHSLFRLTNLSISVLMLIFATSACAQELEPRALSPSPVGLNFVLVNYGYASGNVFFDPALPAEDATGKLHTAAAGYVRTMSLFGAPAKLTAIVPFAWGDWEGLWEGQPTTVSRRGFADPTVDLAVTLSGAPALSLKEMSKYRERLVIGASVSVIAPLGQYSRERLINLGSNRWAFRTRLGLSQRIRRWIFESIGSAWFYTENHEAWGDVSITQDPVLSVQFNAVRLFSRGFWAGVGFGYGEGGQTTVSGLEKNNSQVNRLIGATVIYPLSGRNSLKLTYINSASAAIGADFNRVSLMWLAFLGGGA